MTEPVLAGLNINKQVSIHPNPVKSTYYIMDPLTLACVVRVQGFKRKVHSLWPAVGVQGRSYQRVPYSATAF